jgi:hypothetical protein
MCKNLDKFPVILRDKLKVKDIRFPEGTLFDYESILAYRMIIRESNDTSCFSRKDMQSYAEQGKTRIGVKQIDTTSPMYYGVSLFKTIDKVNQTFNLPKPDKKVAQGHIYKEGGPQYTKDVHVCWWLYDDVDLSGFEIMEKK